MYDPTYNNALDPAATAAFIATFGLFALIGYVVQAIFLGMIFKKAGVESWKAWVPLYNVWVFLELGGQKGWISLLFLLAWVPVLGIIPAIVAFVFTCVAAYRIGLNLGKEGVFVLLYIFVTIVWLIWLAVDKSTWKGVAAPAVQAVPAGPAEASAPVADTEASSADSVSTPESSSSSDDDSSRPPSTPNAQ